MVIPFSTFSNDIQSDCCKIRKFGKIPKMFDILIPEQIEGYSFFLKKRNNLLKKYSKNRNHFFKPETFCNKKHEAYTIFIFIIKTLSSN